MIERYTLPEMGDLWTDDYKFKTWLRVEIAVCEAQAELGYMPQDAVAEIKAKAKFDPQRILEIEAEVRHDVIAFLTNVNEHVGDAGRYIHLGMTSSDMLDTALSLQLVDSLQVIMVQVENLIQAIRYRAQEHRDTVMIGRSHGIHAEPITFGFKLAGWLAEMLRHRERLTHLQDTIAVGKISGAVGTYANIDPKIEALACQNLGLRPDTASTQVISRDIHADFMNALALLGASMERFAVEIRNLQRTDVLEVEEFFSKKQKGSSAMPHKRNPVLTENLTGLARMVRGYVTPALENVALWHERDISHSSVERYIGPDATITLDFALHRMADVVEKLVVYPERMQRNLDLLGGLVHSQRVLLALTQAGVQREDAYRLVQRNAMPVWRAMHNGLSAPTFLENLKADSDVTAALKAEEVEALFDLGHHLKQVDAIFARVFGA